MMVHCRGGLSTRPKSLQILFLDNHRSVVSGRPPKGAGCGSSRQSRHWQSGHPDKKTRPRYSQDGAARALFNQETVSVALEGFQFCFCAFGNHPQGMGEVQTEQLHKGLSVDLVVLITNVDVERAGSSQGYEVLNVFDAAKTDLKFSQKSAPLNLYKNLLFVYNGEQRSKGSTQQITKKQLLIIIPFFCKKATVVLDD